METLDLIDSSQLKSFSISVTEEILPRYLLTFLRTHIENQNFLINENSYFYYYFHKTSLRYEVLVFDKFTKNSFPKPFILKAYPHIKTNTVFLLEDSFCLLIEKEPVLFKKLETLIQEDIREYILQMYNIVVDEFICISNEKIQSLALGVSKEFYKAEKKKIFPYKEQKSFTYFQYFFVSSTVLFFFLLYSIYDKKIESQKYLNISYGNQQREEYKKLILQYKNFQHQTPVKKLTPLLDSLNSLGIKVLKLEYTKGKFFIELIHPKKNKLLKLLANNQLTLKTKVIYFEKSLQSHIMEIEVVY